MVPRAGLRFAQLDRPDWAEDLISLERVLTELPPCRTLDVACGTGFLTRRLRGDVVGLDQSEGMLAIARERMPARTLVRDDALALPFARQRQLNDDSRFVVHKRYFPAAGLAEELGGGHVLHESRWFVVVAARFAP